MTFLSTFIFIFMFGIGVVASYTSKIGLFTIEFLLVLSFGLALFTSRSALHRIGLVLSETLYWWVCIYILVTIHFTPLQWINKPDLCAEWGGMTSMFGIILTFMAQYRIDQSKIIPPPKVSMDPFFIYGLLVTAIGTIIWALSAQSIKDIHDIYSANIVEQVSAPSPYSKSWTLTYPIASNAPSWSIGSSKK